MSDRWNHSSRVWTLLSRALALEGSDIWGFMSMKSLNLAKWCKQMILNEESGSLIPKTFVDIAQLIISLKRCSFWVNNVGTVRLGAARGRRVPSTLRKVISLCLNQITMMNDAVWERKHSYFLISSYTAVWNHVPAIFAFLIIITAILYNAFIHQVFICFLFK